MCLAEFDASLMANPTAALSRRIVPAAPPRTAHFDPIP